MTSRHEALRVADVWVREARADWALALTRISEVEAQLPTEVRAALTRVTAELDGVDRMLAQRLGRAAL